jgi:Fe-S cluster biogenesis protein NfuA
MDQALELAIDELRPSFEADNFKLMLDKVSEDGGVVIAVEVMPEACLDCMIPDGLLQQVVEACVRRHAPGVTSVTVVKRGPSGVPHAN